MLIFAARQEHLVRLIRPALAQGHWVICDRFTDATFAYQGWGRQVGLDKLEALEQLVHGDLQPDLTLLFDAPVEVAMARISGGRELDRFEREQAAFFQRVRQGYLARAARYPERFRVVDAGQAPAAIQQRLEEILVEGPLR
jgi:dTMP kinase